MLPSGGACSCAPALRAMEPAALGNAWISALDSLCLRVPPRRGPNGLFSKIFPEGPEVTGDGTRSGRFFQPGRVSP